jgi:hypothetical protein
MMMTAWREAPKSYHISFLISGRVIPLVGISKFKRWMDISKFKRRKIKNNDVQWTKGTTSDLRLDQHGLPVELLSAVDSLF